MSSQPHPRRTQTNNLGPATRATDLLKSLPPAYEHSKSDRNEAARAAWTLVVIFALWALTLKHVVRPVPGTAARMQILWHMLKRGGNCLATLLHMLGNSSSQPVPCHTGPFRSVKFCKRPLFLSAFGIEIAGSQTSANWYRVYVFLCPGKSKFDMKKVPWILGGINLGIRITFAAVCVASGEACASCYLKSTLWRIYGRVDPAIL